MRELFVDVATVVRENERESDYRGEVEKHTHPVTGAGSGILSRHPAITAAEEAAAAAGEREIGEEGMKMKFGIIAFYKNQKLCAKLGLLYMYGAGNVCSKCDSIV